MQKSQILPPFKTFPEAAISKMELEMDLKVSLIFSESVLFSITLKILTSLLKAHFL